MLKVAGQPRLHNLYGFSVTIQNIKPAGEGSIRKAADLLRIKLDKEGLFDPGRKRTLPYPPAKVGLITSCQSAAYADFLKVLGARWGGIGVELIDVQVQGENAVGQIVEAVAQFNSLSHPPEVLVIIRGGGSPEDLAAFSTEHVTRAVAASRVPTLVAIGHEIDTSLAELAADLRASTPSNAAELLVPDRRHLQTELASSLMQLDKAAAAQLVSAKQDITTYGTAMVDAVVSRIEREALQLTSVRTLLQAFNPAAILERGYAIVRQQGEVVRSAGQLSRGVIVETQLATGSFKAYVEDVTEK